MTVKGQRVAKTPLADQLHDRGVSAFARYRAKAVGDGSFLCFFWYEFFQLFLVNLGGAAGYVLRKIVASKIFGQLGRGAILGRGLTLRHPGAIRLGDDVAIDDNVLLDAGGAGEKGVVLGDGVILSRGCLVQGKTGPVSLASRVDVGCNCVFSSVAGIAIGEAVIIAGNCYLGGGRYYHDKLEEPIMDQGGYSRGELVVGPHSWIGAGAVILDGVRIGKGAIVGAGSVVTGDIDDYTVVAGVPAKPIGSRKKP